MAEEKKTASDQNTTTKAKKPRARYRPTADEVLDTVEWFAGAGLSDWQIAHILRISERTWYRWKRLPQILAAIKRGSEETNIIGKVEKSLIRRALGYEIVQEWNLDGTVKKMKHFEPSEIACMMFLSNKAPDKWKQRVESNITQTNRYVPVELSKMDAQAMRELMVKIAVEKAKRKGERLTQIDPAQKS